MIRGFKIIRVVFSFLPWIVLAYVSLTQFSFSPFKIKSVESSHHLILEKVNNLGQLELTKYQFKDILEQKFVIDYFPDPKALLIIYGEAVGCIDLTQINEEDIVVREDKVFIKLPPPSICTYKVDLQKSSVYNTTNAFMNEAKLVEEAYKAAEKKILESAEESDILTTTHENAIKLLTPILTSLTQKEIVIE